MITTIDKAIVATIMVVLFFINHYTTFHFFLTEDQVTAVVGVLMPILVYQVKNKSS